MLGILTAAWRQLGVAEPKTSIKYKTHLPGFLLAAGSSC